MKKIYSHEPVLLHEVIQGLAIKPTGIYVDATFGRGGHSRSILDLLDDKGFLLALDKDPEAVLSVGEELQQDKRFAIEQGTFSELLHMAEKHQLIGKVDGILLDLGVSSPQLDNPNRGFSFLKDGPLDMRMDTTTGMDAATWLNAAKGSQIAEILKLYGEEPMARRIANAIVVERVKQPILTTLHLASIVRAVKPSRERDRGKHPATQTFQAIRIYINKELDELKHVLEQSLELLAVGGRLVVISFHSLEDRIVKRFIRLHEGGDIYPFKLPIQHAQIQPRLRSVRRVLKPSIKEITSNPRARSARLRIAEKLV